jgi:hypothetical protein
MFGLGENWKLYDMFLFITFYRKTLLSAVISEWPRVAPRKKLLYSPK